LLGASTRMMLSGVGASLYQRVYQSLNVFIAVSRDRARNNFWCRPALNTHNIIDRIEGKA